MYDGNINKTYSRSTAIRILLAYLLNLFDVVCTTLWVNLYGLSIEANPIGRTLYLSHLAIPVKVIVIGAIMYTLHILLKREPKWSWVSYLVLIVYGLIGLYHTFIGIYLLLI